MVPVLMVLVSCACFEYHEIQCALSIEGYLRIGSTVASSKFDRRQNRGPLHQINFIIVITSLNDRDIG